MKMGTFPNTKGCRKKEW